MVGSTYQGDPKMSAKDDHIEQPPQLEAAIIAT